MPALFIRTSGGPIVAETDSYNKSAPSGALRSAAKLRDSQPRVRICSLVPSAGRRLPWHATEAPASASASAMAAPSPPADPVTSASFPSRRNRSRIPIPYLAQTGRLLLRYGELQCEQRWGAFFLPGGAVVKVACSETGPAYRYAVCHCF